MHLIWGKQTKIIEVYHDNESICEDCNSGTLTYFIYQDYYHLFWMPAFPIAKYGGIMCNNCEKSKVKVINTKLTEYEKMTKTPLLMYSVPLFFISLIIIANVLEYFFT